MYVDITTVFVTDYCSFFELALHYQNPFAKILKLLIKVNPVLG